MSRRLLLGFSLVLAAAAPGQAQDDPERLLSPTTQLYVRWDGVTPHKAAYDASVWGPIMKGPTGDTIRALLAKGPKLLGASLLAEPLLDGKPPAELRAVHADLKNVEKVIDLLADKGIIVAAEVKEPRPTLKGIGTALGGLLGGNDGKPPEGLLPEVTLFLVVPNVGDRADILFAPTRLYNRTTGGTVATPLPPELKVKGFNWPTGEGSSVHLGEWVIDGHFVEYAGTLPVETAVARMRENAAQGGATGHPLFQRCLKTGTFESVARGYVDAASVVSLGKRLAGPFVPGLGDKLDAVGVGNLKAVVFSSGFDGKESRALYEFDLPGERKGFARLFKPSPLTPGDLPPLPPDVSRFSMLRVDLPAAFDAGLTAIDALVPEQFGAEDGAKTPAEVSRRRKEFLERELTKFSGLNVREDLLPHLGDKVCVFQTPTEGLSVFGSVVCVSVKNPAEVRVATDRLNRVLEALAEGQMKVRKKVLKGVEIREVYGRGFGILTPTYAVVGDWLVVAGYPQPVQGMVLRHAGDLERWRPDADTAARLAKMPTDAIGIQFCNPKSTAQNLCVIGPLVLSTITQFTGRNQSEYEPLDIGLIPNGHELSKHLFPNLTYTRDDGKTLRVEVNESFSLPLEFIGLEPFSFFVFVSAARF